MFRLAVLLMLLVGPANAQDDGVYKPKDRDRCPVQGTDDWYFEIDGNDLIRHESVCELTKPVSVNNMNATLYTAVCEGEGTLWAERVMLLRTYSGLTYVDENGGFNYTRCGED